MKYSDIFTPANGVFTVMQDEANGVFESLFEGRAAADLDCFAFMQAAEKLLLPSINASNYSEILTSLYFARYDSWQRIKQALETPVTVGTVTTTETTTGSDTGSDTDSITDTDSDKGFDSTEFKPTNKSDRQQTQARNREYQQTKTTSREVDNVQRVIDTAVEVGIKRNLVDIVCYDILTRITLQVYA